MTRSLHLASSVLAAVLLGADTLGGCGGSPETLDAGDDALVAPRVDSSVDAPGALDAAMPGSLSAYCRPLALDLCTAASSCGCEVILPGVGLDVEGCTARLEAECIAAWSPFVEAGARGGLAAAAGRGAHIEASTPEVDSPSGVYRVAPIPMSTFDGCPLATINAPTSSSGVSGEPF